MTFLSSLVARFVAVVRESLIGWPTPISLRPALFVGVSLMSCCVGLNLGHAQATEREETVLEPFEISIGSDQDGGEKNVKLSVQTAEDLEEGMGLVRRISNAYPKQKVVVFNLLKDTAIVPTVRGTPLYREIVINAGAQIQMFDNAYAPYSRGGLHITPSTIDQQIIDRALLRQEQNESDLRTHTYKVVVAKMFIHGFLQWFVYKDSFAGHLTPLIAMVATTISLSGVYQLYLKEFLNDCSYAADVMFKKFGLPQFAVKADGPASDFHTVHEINGKKAGMLVPNFFFVATYYLISNSLYFYLAAHYRPDAVADLVRDPAYHFSHMTNGVILNAFIKNLVWVSLLDVGGDSTPSMAIRNILQRTFGFSGTRLQKSWVAATAIFGAVTTSLYQAATNAANAHPGVQTPYEFWCKITAVSIATTGAVIYFKPFFTEYAGPLLGDLAAKYNIKSFVEKIRAPLVDAYHATSLAQDIARAKEFYPQSLLAQKIASVKEWTRPVAEPPSQSAIPSESPGSATEDVAVVLVGRSEKLGMIRAAKFVANLPSRAVSKAKSCIAELRRTQLDSW